MKNYIPLYLIALFSILQIGYAQNCPVDERFSEIDYFTAAEIDSVWDVHYGSALNEFGHNVNLELDIYYPKNTIDLMYHRPVVVLIHGGAFVTGDKSNLRNDCREFAKKGYVCATINYRLGISASVETQYRAAQDAFAALRFLAHQNASYHINPHQMFVGGISAGSVTTLNMAFVSAAEWNLYSPNIANTLGGLHNSGNDFTDTYTILGLYNNAGATYQPFVQNNEMISAINFHGALDPIVAIDGIPNGFIGLRTLHYMYENANVCSEMIVDPQGGHVLYSSLAGIVFRVKKVSCFFRNILCASCTSLYTTDPDEAHCGADLQTDENDISEFRVSPNPFDNYLQISSDEPIHKYELYSADGKLIFSGNEIENVNFSYLKPAVYQLKLFFEKGEKTVPVLKK